MPTIRHKELRVRNGYAYKDLVVPLDQQGLVLVRGINLDDGGFLGTGKTSLWELWALAQYGQTGKHRRGGDRQSADDVVNRIVGKDFESEFDFEVDDHPYQLYQYRQHTQHGTRYGCRDVATGQDVLPRKARHQWVQDNILKIDSVSFFNLVYLTQDFSSSVLHGTDAERRNSLAKMFGLDVYDTLLDLTKQEVQKTRAILQDSAALQAELDQLNQRLTGVVYQDVRAAAKQAFVEYKALDRQQATAMDQWRQASEALQASRLRADLIQQIKDQWAQADLGDLAESARQIDSGVCRDLQQEIHRLEKVAARHAIVAETAKKRKILQARLDAADAARPAPEIDQDLQDVRARHHAAQQELPVAEQRAALRKELAGLVPSDQPIETLQASLERVQRDIAKTKVTIDTVKVQLDTGVCPTCHRAFDHVDIDAGVLQQQIKTARESLQAFQQQYRDLAALVQATTQHAAVSARLAALSKTRKVQDITADISTLAQQERVLVTEGESRRQRDLIESALSGLPEVSGADKTLMADLEQKITDQRARLAAALKILSLRRALRQTTAEKLQVAREAEQTAKQELDTIVAAVGPAGEASATAMAHYKEIKEATQRRKRLKAGLASVQGLQDRIQCLDVLKFAFGSQGLKQDRFNAILTDAVATTVPQYTEALWPRHTTSLQLHDDGAAVKLNLRRQDGTVIDASLLSGGERHKAGLALLLGLRDLQAQYQGVDSNLLVVDEPFGNLDPQGARSLLRIFSNLQQKFGSVFIVSHRPEVFDSAVWTQVWWVVRKNGIATLYRDGLPDKLRTTVKRYSDVL
jgi:ABC-type phosphate transport system ATPase subunit